MKTYKFPIKSWREGDGWFPKYMIRNEPLQGRAGFYFNTLCTAAIIGMWAIAEVDNALHPHATPVSHNLYEQVINYMHSFESLRDTLAIATVSLGSLATLHYSEMRRKK